MVKGRVIQGDSAKIVVVQEPGHCTGCAVKSCGGKSITFSMPSSMTEGVVALELPLGSLGLVLLHSLGLPLAGLMAGVVIGVIMQWSEGSQFAMGCLGFVMLAACCRGFESTLISVMRDEN